MKPKTFITLLLIFSLAIALILSYIVIKRIEYSYLRGYSDGVESVTLSDLCIELKETCVGTDFVAGYGFKIFECKVITGDWRDDWEIPEEYEVEETEEGVRFRLKSNE